MNDNRALIDKFLYEIKESGMITLGGKVLEIGVGKNYDHFSLLGSFYEYYPTDCVLMGGVPKVQWLDAHDFSTSPLTSKIKEWDAIIACEILEHAIWPGKVCQQAYKYLKIEGIFVVTVPFWYRLHESSPDDPAIVEEGMKDYWRITPSGMKVLFEASGFSEFYVSAKFKEKDYIYCPSYVMGWAKKTASGGKPIIHEDWEYKWGYNLNRL
jgi:SAM-dependent methyltransferase